MRDVLLLNDARRSPLREERVDNPLPNIVVHSQVDTAKTAVVVVVQVDSISDSPTHSLFDICPLGTILGIQYSITASIGP